MAFLHLPPSQYYEYIISGSLALMVRLGIKGVVIEIIKENNFKDGWYFRSFRYFGSFRYFSTSGIQVLRVLQVLQVLRVLQVHHKRIE